MPDRRHPGPRPPERASHDPALPGGPSDASAGVHDWGRRARRRGPTRRTCRSTRPRAAPRRRRSPTARAAAGRSYVLQSPSRHPCRALHVLTTAAAGRCLGAHTWVLLPTRVPCSAQCRNSLEAAAPDAGRIEFVRCSHSRIATANAGAAAGAADPAQLRGAYARIHSVGPRRASAARPERGSGGCGRSGYPKCQRILTGALIAVVVPEALAAVTLHRALSPRSLPVTRSLRPRAPFLAFPLTSQR